MIDIGKSAVLVVLVLALSSCSNGSDFEFLVLSKDGSTVLVLNQDVEGMEALFAGTVTKLPSGCFGINSNEETYPVIWPKATSLSDDATALRLSDGTVVTEGMAINGGGGLDSASLRADNLPSACDADTVVVLNSVTIAP